MNKPRYLQNLVEKVTETKKTNYEKFLNISNTVQRIESA